MWVSPAVFCLLCLGLVTSAPTIGDSLGDNGLSEETSETGHGLADLGSIPDLNNTSSEEDDYDLWREILADLDAAEDGEESLNSNSSLNNVTLEDLFASEDGISTEGGASSEEIPASDSAPTSSEAPTSKAIATTAEPAPPAEDNTSANENPSSAGENPSPSSSSSSSSSSSAAEEEEYDYYDYSDIYGDYTPPTAFPFNMFSDMVPRPPVTGDVLPSSCAWAVVQCCDNPDKMGSRVSCFSHVGCYGAWFQDFCTPELKKVVFKSVFKSFKFTP